MRRLPFLTLLILGFTSLALAAPPPGHTITIQVVNQATGDPIVGAEVASGREKAQTDDYGQCALTIPANQRYLSFTVHKADFASMAVAWRDVTAVKHFPDQLTFSMEPGTTIGGIVEDEHNHPVAGATIDFSGGFNPDGVIRSVIDGTATTDANGKWSIHTAPGHLGQFWVRASHPGFANDQSYQNAPPVPQLRSRTAVITLPHAVQITGKILDPAGHPVENADVASGEPGWGGIRHRARSNADGSFTLTGLHPGSVTFTVVATNFAPAAVTVATLNTTSVDVHLKPGAPMKFHVVDKAGKPLLGVQISVEQWQNLSTLAVHLRTDADGNATWANAPDDQVYMNLRKRGFGDIVHLPLTAGPKPIDITLGPKTRVQGTVVDAATGQPVKDFTIISGIGWGEQQDIYWEGAENGAAPKPGHDGKFTYAPNYDGYPQYAVRIEAPGYLPTDSRRFADDEGDLPLEFKMTKGAWITGAIYAPDHKPLTNAEVFLVAGNNGQFQIETHAEVSQWARQQSTSSPTDAHGHFSFSPQSDAFDLVCVNDAGYAMLNVPALKPSPAASQNPMLETPAASPTTRPASYDLTLQSWATVQGTLMIGSKPGADQQVDLQAFNAWTPNQPRVFFSYTTTTDSQGHFHFDRVPPESVQVSRMVPSGQSSMQSETTPVNPEPGKTSTVQIGGTGRPIIGKFALPASFTPGSWIAWYPTIRTHIQMPKGPDMPLGVRIGSADAKRKWFAQWARTKEGKAFLEAQKRASEGMTTRIYALIVDPSGSFRIDDVPSGTYDLDVQFFPPGDRQNWGHPLATARKQIVVPPMPTGRSDEPLDVGVVPVKTAQ